jgi:hypothetical protein
LLNAISEIPCFFSIFAKYFYICHTQSQIDEKGPNTNYCISLPFLIGIFSTMEIGPFRAIWWHFHFSVFW